MLYAPFASSYELSAVETINYTKQTMPDLIERVSGSITAMLEGQD